jgi:hypothetical protein
LPAGPFTGGGRGRALSLFDVIRRAPATEYLLVESSGLVYGVLATRDVDHAFADL